MAPKITIVGGGSTHWTPRLLTDFANTPSLAGAEVALHDVDEPSLAPMLAIGKHIAASRDIGLQVTAGTDLPRALEGADFVISAFTVGGFESMRHDLEIPALHGLRQPVGDSVGPGGIFRSLRSIPVMVSIAREVERRAPGALLLNVSNPMTALCRAVTSQTSVRTVGLCNELVGLQSSSGFTTRRLVSPNSSCWSHIGVSSPITAPRCNTGLIGRPAIQNGRTAAA